jgi:hypothetical protein
MGPALLSLGLRGAFSASPYGAVRQLAFADVRSTPWGREVPRCGQEPHGGSRHYGEATSRADFALSECDGNLSPTACSHSRKYGVLRKHALALYPPFAFYLGAGNEAAGAVV